MKNDLFKSKNSKSNTEKKYSSIQYFFWLLSGCEISILKDCPTDYNRQAGIGFTIFMTTVLAFFSGSYAGWYFGESYVTAIIFGLLWSALIFSIDRSMVVTLKKDPTIKEQKFWVPLISRGIMALLIAFIISIPLELLIFHENIEANMAKYKKDQTNELQQASTRNENIADKIADKKETNILVEQVKEELAAGEPKGDPTYESLKIDYNILNSKYNIVSNNYNLSRSAKNAAKKRIPNRYNSVSNSYTLDKSSIEWKRFKNYEENEKKAKNDLNAFDVVALNKANREKIDYKNKWINDKTNEKQTYDTNVKDQTLAISKSKGKIVMETVKQDSITKNQKGFVLRFMILENLASRYKKVMKHVEIQNIDLSNVAVDSTSNSINNNIVGNINKKEWIQVEEYSPEGASIFFLLWLIRILFFTIEILPTIAKIATPIGAYDFAIYRKEREIEEDLVKRTEDYLLHQKAIRELENSAHREQIIEKNKIENELHSGMLKEIASAQNDVAKKQIEDFRIKHT